MDTIAFDQFEKVDIRIGTVTEATVPEWSHWVMRIKADLGPELGEKQCFSGIMKFFKPEDLVGKQFPFVVNLEPRKIGPEHEMSEAMMIMSVPGDGLPEEEAESVAPVLFQLQDKVPNGTKVR
jgi:methionine--tRNA ligase beta chain